MRTKFLIIATLIATAATRRPQYFNAQSDSPYQKPLVQPPASGQSDDQTDNSVVGQQADKSKSISRECIGAIGRATVGLKKVAKAIQEDLNIDQEVVNTIKKQLNVGTSCDSIYEVTGINPNGCAGIIVDLLQIMVNKKTDSHATLTQTDLLAWVTDLQNGNTKTTACFDISVAQKNNECLNFMKSTLNEWKSKCIKQVLSGGPTSLISMKFDDFVNIGFLMSFVSSCGSIAKAVSGGNN